MPEERKHIWVNVKYIPIKYTEISIFFSCTRAQEPSVWLITVSHCFWFLVIAQLRGKGNLILLEEMYKSNFLGFYTKIF